MIKLPMDKDAIDAWGNDEQGCKLWDGSARKNTLLRVMSFSSESAVWRMNGARAFSQTSGKDREELREKYGIQP